VRPTTASTLQTILDDDILWRRREITSLVTTIGLVDIAAKATLVRSGIPLLYAHWEGFGRTCFERYLEFVSYRNLKYDQLASSFFYLKAIGRIHEIGRVPPRQGISILPELLEMKDSKHRDPMRKMANTKSNLRYDVLIELLAVCGLDSTYFASDKTFIDSDLCDARNEIAHGAGGAPSVSTFTNRRDRTFGLMTGLHTLVVNAAVMETYKAKAA